MQISFIFSHRHQIGSKLISWAAKFENLNLKKNPSHAAILVNNRFVIESVMGRGVRIVPYFKWVEINQELYRIEYNDISRELFDGVLLTAWGKKYDWLGIVYFAYRYLLLALFKIPLPQKNKLERASHVFCTELIGKLTNNYYAMTSPAKMCDKLLGEQ